MNKKLSIITINFNNAKGLEKTINSVVKQSYKNYEYIIIDGGSSDESLEIINSNKSNISYIISEPDNGIYNAMNKGINLSSGEYLLFLNSGDFLYSNQTIEKVFDLKLDKDVNYGDVMYDDNGKFHLVDFPNEKEISHSFFRKSNLSHPSTFIKKDLFLKHGFYNEEFKISSDWEFFIVTICKYNASTYKIPFIISVYDFAGISSKKENLYIIDRERNIVYNKHFKYFNSDYKRLSNLEANMKKIKSILFIRILLKLKSKLTH